MKNEKFDHLLSQIQNEQVDDRVVAQAGERVLKSIAGSPSDTDLSTHTLRSCEDFRALIPAYVEKKALPGTSVPI